MRMESERVRLTAEIVAEIKPQKGAVVAFDSYVELSADCYICQKTNRTLILAYGEDHARCIKENHLLPAKITEIEAKENKVKYFIELDYHEFKEKKYGITSTNIIKWARVHFNIICPNCNDKIESSTQNNRVRPRNFYCQCGQLLYIENDEMPVIKNNC